MIHNTIPKCREIPQNIPHNYNFAMPHHDPAAISRLARSMGYYEVELPTMQEFRGRRFRHLTKLGGVTVDVTGHGSRKGLT